MPSRKLTVHCPRCGCKNHLKAGYCNQCGIRLKEDLATKDQEGRTKLYADIAHPINSACREMIQNRVIAEYEAELVRAQQPDYVSRYDDDFGVGDVPSSTHIDTQESGLRPPHAGSKRSARRSDKSSDEAQDNDFGAGIF
jgi:stage V sporulation protein G